MESILKLRNQITKPKYTCYLATLNATKNFGMVPELRPVSLMIWNWRFFIATSVKSRKAQEIIKQPMVSFLVPLQRDGFNGYLRVAGATSQISDPSFGDEVGRETGYPITKYWEQGGKDQDLFFAEIKPIRIEFMDPGEHEAIDITADFSRILKTSPNLQA